MVAVNPSDRFQEEQVYNEDLANTAVTNIKSNLEYDANDLLVENIENKSRTKDKIQNGDQFFYLPKDVELRDKILNIRDELNLIIPELDKKFSDLDQGQADKEKQNFIENYVRLNGLTMSQVKGEYPEPQTDFYKSIVNSGNIALNDILNNIIDFSYYTSPGGYFGALKDPNGPFGDQILKESKPELNVIPQNKKMKDQLYEVFTFLNAIDPTFTPDTFAERVGDNMGRFAIESLPFTGAMTFVTKANKLKLVDPDLVKGIGANVKQKASMMYNQMIDIYADAKAQGKLGRQVADDILAVMGWSFGTDVAKAYNQEVYGDDLGILNEAQKVTMSTFFPFLTSSGFTIGGKVLYDLPVASYQALKKFMNQYAAYNNTPSNDGVEKNLYNFWKDKKDLSKQVEIAEEINTQINPLEQKKRVESLDLEKRLNKYVVQQIEEQPDGSQIIVNREVTSPEQSLNFTLAQATENPRLQESQKAIESSLIDAGFFIKGGQNMVDKANKIVKDFALNNYKVVDAALEREFPNAQYIYTTVIDEQGNEKVVPILQKVGNFGSYFNTNNRVGGVLDQNIQDEILTQESILTPGTIIKDEKVDIRETGVDLRNKYLTLKDQTREKYDDQLLQLVDDSFGDRSFDATEFKDNIIKNIAPKDFDDPAQVPRQFYQIRDLGNDFEPIINNASQTVENLYNKYLNEPTTSNYKKYLEDMKQVEINLNKKINSLNDSLQKKLESGDIQIAPKYDMGEIKFNYPEAVVFDDAGKIIKGVDNVGESYMGRIVNKNNPPRIGEPGESVIVNIEQPTLSIPIKSAINLKENALKDLNEALAEPEVNSDLIKRLRKIIKEVDGLIEDNLGGIQAYEDWRLEKKLNYTDIFESGQIKKITTKTGGEEYVIPDEAVGMAFLKNADSVDEFFMTLGDDFDAVNGIKNAFFNKLFNPKGGVLNKDGLIDINKLKLFRQNNEEVINALDEHLDINSVLDSQIKLGVEAANRLKVSQDRAKFADFIELDNFIKTKDTELNKTGLTYKNPDDMIKQALKDPEQMTDIVKVLSKIDKSDKNANLLQAFKNQLFDKFLEAAKQDKNLLVGDVPNDSGMTKFLKKNEDSIKAYYNAIGDEEGYQRLLDITEAYRKLNLTGYPQKLPGVNLNVVQKVFGTGIPQILSRVFAAVSGRTSGRFVGTELGMRFMLQLNTTQREKIIASALYSKENAEALMDMLSKKPLTEDKIVRLKAMLGKAYGMIATTEDKNEPIKVFPEKQEVPYGFDKIDYKLLYEDKKTDDLDSSVRTISSLKIPNVSPASSLSNVNMANMTRATMPETLKRGQALFGANDPIFGGIASV